MNLDKHACLASVGDLGPEQRFAVQSEDWAGDISLGRYGTVRRYIVAAEWCGNQLFGTYAAACAAFERGDIDAIVSVVPGIYTHPDGSQVTQYSDPVVHRSREPGSIEVEPA